MFDLEASFTSEPGTAASSLLVASLPAVIALFGSVLLVWLTHQFQRSRERSHANAQRKIRALEEIAEAIKEFQSGHELERSHMFDEESYLATSGSGLSRATALAAIHFPDDLDPEFSEFNVAASTISLDVVKMRKAILEYNVKRPANDPDQYSAWIDGRDAHLKPVTDEYKDHLLSFYASETKLLQAMSAVARSAHGTSK